MPEIDFCRTVTAARRRTDWASRQGLAPALLLAAGAAPSRDLPSIKAMAERILLLRALFPEIGAKLRF
jgi:hypothetical protein